MSRSRFKMNLEFHMLDGRWQCVPELRDTSGGHMIFKTGNFALRTGGPASWTFDELDGPYDREKWIVNTKARFIEEMTKTNLLDHMFGGLFDQAKQHCDDCHKDMRAREAKDEWTRKGH